MCSYKLVSEPGSQISVNFLDMDLPVDATQTCSDYVQLIEETGSASALIGRSGRLFCGQQLPNYPGPSVLVSGIIKLIKDPIFNQRIVNCSQKYLECELSHCINKSSERKRLQGELLKNIFGT